MTPRDIVTEQRRLAMLAQDYARTRAGGSGENAVMRDAFVHRIATAIGSAVPFSWSRESVALALSSPLPEHIVANASELLPFPAMWWRFEGDQPLSRGGRASGWLVLSDLESVDVIAIEETPPDALADGRKLRPGLGFAYEIVRTGVRFPVDIDPLDLDAATKLLSLLAFASSRYVTLRAVKPSTDEQRARLSRRGMSVIEPDVIVVTLRAPSMRPRVEGATRTGRDWSHRWVVRGHHRAQWYPSMAAHRVVWIAPHIKGPADKPLKDQLYAVVR